MHHCADARQCGKAFPWELGGEQDQGQLLHSKQGYISTEPYYETVC